jgi:hypothetical protein
MLSMIIFSMRVKRFSMIVDSEKRFTTMARAEVVAIEVRQEMRR